MGGIFVKNQRKLTKDVRSQPISTHSFSNSDSLPPSFEDQSFESNDPMLRRNSSKRASWHRRSNALSKFSHSIRRSSQMGKNQSKIPPAELKDLLARTRFTEGELKEWYNGFKRDCPDGRLTLAQFTTIYSEFYGTHEAKKFAEHLFRTFDVNQDGRIDFREFICSLSITTRGSFDEKLRWAFDVYDIDGNGVISLNEVLAIVQSINRMMGYINDKNASQERILNVFKNFDKNHDQMLSLEEFIDGAKRDTTFVKMLQCSE